MAGSNPHTSPGRAAARIALLYAALGVAWIVLSDTAVDRWIEGIDAAAVRSWVQSAKGILFVIVTASVVYLLVRREMRATDEAHRAVAEKEERYRRLVELCPDLVVVHGHERIRFLNASARALFGLGSGDEAHRRRILDFIHPDERALMATRVSRVLETGEAQPFVDRRLALPDGRELWVESAIVPFEEGNAREAMFVFRDVTERRTEQMRRLEAARLETIGRLASAVAHDLNNVLTAIAGFSELALAEIEAPETRESVETVLQASARATALTSRLLALARRTDAVPTVVRVASVADSILPILRRLMPSKVELRFEPPDPAHAIFADPHQIEQVLMNVILNARDAIATRGTVTVTVDRVEERDVPAERPPAANAATWVRLRVRDDGCGMAPEVLAQARRPFFTTKPEGRGTGLGLSLVEQLVHGASGFVAIQSASGEGTTVDVYLPAVQAEGRSDDPAAARNGTGLRRGSGRVLVAEDDNLVRTFLARALDQAGYDVVETANGLDAIARARESGEPFRLAVVDADLPGLDGRALVSELQTLPTAPRTLLITGLPKLKSECRGKAARPSAELRKPFTARVFVQTVADVLEAPSEYA